MIIGTLEMVARFFRWLAYLAHRRTEWLVVVQDYTARMGDPHAVVPRHSIEAPDGVKYRIRAVPGWSGENPRYRSFRRMREHVFPAELRGIVPGYVEVRPSREAAENRAAEIEAEVRGGRWSPLVEPPDATTSTS